MSKKTINKSLLKDKKDKYDYDQTMEVVNITPKLAAEYLSCNSGNRPINPNHVNTLLNEFNTNRWLLNGQPIAFDANGKLADGQHRLTACIRLNKNFQSWVVRGVPPSSFETFGNQVMRTKAQVLRIAGHKHASQLSALLSNIYMYNKQNTSFFTHIKISHTLIAQMAKDNPEAIESVDCISRIKGYRKIPGYARLMFIHYLIVFRADHDRMSLDNRRHWAECFFTSLIDGENLNKTSPVLHLRNKILTGKSTNSALNRLDTLREYYALFIKAWGYFATEKPMKLLRLTRNDYEKISAQKWQYF